MASNRAVVFDLDGTLVDAFSDIAAAVNVPLAARGYRTHSVQEIKRMVGDGAGKLIERAAPPGLSPHETRAIFEEMMTHYREHPADLAVVYPGVFPLLQRLADSGIRLAVLSNKPHPMTLKTCDDLGLTKYFDDILGEVTGQYPRKPDPRGLQAQLQRLGARTSIMVGDGIPDAQVANAARIPFIGCLWGTRNADELSRFNPVGLAQTVDDLGPLILDGLNGSR